MLPGNPAANASIEPGHWNNRAVLLPVPTVQFELVSEDSGEAGNKSQEFMGEGKIVSIPTIMEIRHAIPSPGPCTMFQSQRH